MCRHVQQVPTADVEMGRVRLMACVRSLHTYTMLPATLMPTISCLCLTACRKQDPMRRGVALHDAYRFDAVAV